MKKILSTLLSIFLLGIMGMSAQEVVKIDISKLGLKDGPITEIPVPTESNVASVVCSGKNSEGLVPVVGGTQIKIYTNNQLTITTKDGYVATSVVFNHSKNGVLNPDQGTIKSQGGIQTWTGNANKIVFTASAQVRINTIEITLETGTVTPPVEQVATPVISPNGGVFEIGGSIHVTITCPTENANIVYSDNGTDYSAYPTGGIDITESCTLYAKATNGVMKPSEIAKAVFQAQNLNILNVTFDFTDVTTLGIEPIAQSTGYNLNGDNNKLSKDGITLTFTNGSTPSRIWNSKGKTTLRTYKNGGSITVSVPETSEYTLDAIVFTGSKVNLKALDGTLTGKEWDNTWLDGTGQKDILSVKFENTNSTSEIQTITITKAVATGVKDSEINVISIFGTEGGIEIAGVENYVEVYNVYGQLVASEYVSGNATIAVPSGIKIVKVGNTVVKVNVK